jgi:hypothetical protein
MVLALCVGWRPSNRHVGYMLVAPLFSVGGLAWTAGNPFNASVFVALAFVLLFTAGRFAHEPVRLSAPLLVSSGALLLAFGWWYPHFVKPDHWLIYAYASPFGLIPCPTLSVLIGLTLMVGLFRSKTWTTILALAGLMYGVIGVFRLGVVLDYGLLAGAIVLTAVLARSSMPRRSMRSQEDGQLGRRHEAA